MKRRIIITSKIPLVVPENASAELLMEDIIDIFQEEDTLALNSVKNAKELRKNKFVYILELKEVK